MSSDSPTIPPSPGPPQPELEPEPEPADTPKPEPKSAESDAPAPALLGLSAIPAGHICLECGLVRYAPEEEPCDHSWDRSKAKHSCEVCGFKSNEQRGVKKHHVHTHGPAAGSLLPGADGFYRCKDCPGRIFRSVASIVIHKKKKHPIGKSLELKSITPTEALEKLYNEHPNFPQVADNGIDFMSAYHKLMMIDEQNKSESQ